MDATVARRLKWAIGIAIALALRCAVVISWHAPAGDGLQYYRLSQELAAHGRFAFATDPAPLIWTRLPGYPLFLAYVAVRHAPLSLQNHLIRATLANVLLDIGTALLAASLVTRLKMPRLPALTFALVLVCPPLLFLSCYGLTESLATFLGMLEVWLAVRATDDRPLTFAALAGLVGGLAQMVRVDMLGFVPAVLIVLLMSKSFALRRRFAAVALYAFVLLVAFGAWPLRNQLRFGAPHPQGTEWIGQDGAPLPTGMLTWMRSWARGAPGEAYPLMLVANGRPLDPNAGGQLLTAMYDDPTEKAELVALYRLYDDEHLSARVDEGFRRLAAQRAERHPIRQHLWLPLRRAIALWSPIPDYELPMRTMLLGLPAARAVYDVATVILLLLSVVGVVLLFRLDRVLAAAIIVATMVRTMAIAYVHPFPTQRYVAELMPLLMAAAALAALRLATLARRNARR